MLRKAVSYTHLDVYKRQYLENRKTHQCWPSYRNIGKAVGMSENTVRKYVAMLEEHGLITTAYTIMRAKDGRPMNGHLMLSLIHIYWYISRRPPEEEPVMPENTLVANTPRT